MHYWNIFFVCIWIVCIIKLFIVLQVMAAHYGNIGEFVPEEELIHVYLERVQLFMDANSVKKEKQKSVLLSVIGPKVYGILRSLLAPQLPSADDVSFDDIMGALKSHYDPKPSEIAERFHFYRRAQVPLNPYPSMLQS